ncbi:MAG TPA: acetyltransferase [Chryseosolibacter sp.]|nr:acetyltransferase [Chryseosolibacter sp.]
MKKPLLIYGAGGLGRELLAWLKMSAEWKVDGFVDDTLEPGSRIHGLEILGNLSWLEARRIHTFVILALGDPAAKARVRASIHNPLIDFPAVIHPSARLLDPQSVSIGKGSVICAGCILTCDISLGEHVLLNLNTTVGHDVTVGDYSSIMVATNIAGGVQIEDAVLIGSGSNVKNNTRIGARSVVGMGSVVIRDVDVNCVVAGVPAKKLSK